MSLMNMGSFCNSENREDSIRDCPWYKRIHSRMASWLSTDSLFPTQLLSPCSSHGSLRNSFILLESMGSKLGESEKLRADSIPRLETWVVLACHPPPPPSSMCRGTLQYGRPKLGSRLPPTYPMPWRSHFTSLNFSVLADKVEITCFLENYMKRCL